MKRTGLVVVLAAGLLMGCTSNTKMEVGFKTTMKVNAVFNAKDVAKGEVINAKFIVENTGDSPLVLSDVKGSCTCTVADYPEDPIAPGESGVIKADVKTESFPPGPITRTITILSNTTPASTTVAVKANIIK